MLKGSFIALGKHLIVNPPRPCKHGPRVLLQEFDAHSKLQCEGHTVPCLSHILLCFYRITGLECFPILLGVLTPEVQSTFIFMIQHCGSELSILYQCDFRN